jgi:glutathione S-transferase
MKYGPTVAKTLAAAAVGMFVFKKAMRAMRKSRKAAATKARRAAQVPGVVYLFTFPETPTLGQISGPCAKLETFLKLNKIKYEIVKTVTTATSPTGRLPMIEIDGVAVADSTFAIEYLIEKFNITESLSPAQEAKGIALRRIIEESARLSVLRFTFVDNTSMMVDRFHGLMPTAPRFIFDRVVRGMRKGLITMLNLHGHGDLTDEQYQQEFLADIKAIEQLLSQSQFAVADVPTRYDASVYGWLKANFLQADLPVGKCPALAYAAASAPIQAYMTRVEAAIKA